MIYWFIHRFYFNKIRDETEHRDFFVAITALSLFIICLLFLDAENKREREINGDKKNARSSISSKLGYA